MCGIVGANFNEAGVAAGRDAIAYRGPDFGGSFGDGRMFLGHRRLSIIDLDPRANQPMTSSDGGVTIIFNGEIYNYRALRMEMEADAPFRSTSDTEVILRSYQRFGDACVSRLQGMFAFAIYDRPRQRILLARDVHGIKPLYYYLENGKFAFASEMKALVEILRGEGVRYSLDTQSVRSFLSLGYIPSPGTLCEQIKKLERSHVLAIDLSNGATGTPVSFGPSGLRQVSDRSSFKGLIEEKILAHLASDVPVGVFFSGGTDSSLIASVLNAHDVHLTTFSLQTTKSREDRSYFDRINALLKLDCRTFDFGPREFADAYALVQSHSDEPLMDSSIYPTTYLSTLAAKHVKVVLSGEGGDEFFYGYARQAVLAKMNRAARPPSLDEIERIRMVGRLTGDVRASAMLRSPYAYYLFSMSPMAHLLDSGILAEAAASLWSANAVPKDLDKDVYLENDLLRKIDLATSYASIEGRVPLLDVEIAANSADPAFVHQKDGEMKSFLKDLLTDYLPTDLVYRPKTGFGLGKDMLTNTEIREDVKQGVDLVNGRSILKKRLVTEQLFANEPHACYALASLYRSMRNLGLA